MRKQNFLKAILAAIGLCILILDSNLALHGAQDGIELCIKTVIPALFPFFVVSMLLISSISTDIPYPISVLSGCFGIPKPASPVIIPALLGGYPVGAKAAADFYRQNRIRKQEAERLLAFCSNAGPSFLFGMVAGFFPERKTVWILWAIHILSAYLTAISIPAGITAQDSLKPAKTQSMSSVIPSAAKAMVSVCCWVILFRIVITFLDAWFLWMFPEWVQVFLMGILELTNGCCELYLIQDLNLRFVLCSCMLAFGGMCVLFQTASVTGGLSLGFYITGKLIQTSFSFLLSFAVLSESGYILILLIPVCIIFFRKIQNRYRNPRIVPV